MNVSRDNNISEHSLSSEALASLSSDVDPLVTSYHIIRHFLTPGVCIFSMVALVLTLIFLHKKKNCRINAQIYLKSMGYIDLMNLVVIFISSLDYFMISSHVNAYYTSACVRSLHGCLVGLLLASNWLMTAQAIERTISISRPFKAKQIREKHRRIVVSVICAASILFTIPTLVLDVLELSRYTHCDRKFSELECIYLESQKLDLHIDSSKTNINISLNEQLPQDLNHSQEDLNVTISTQFEQMNLKDKWPQSLIVFQLVQAWIFHFIIFFALPFIFLCLASFRLLYAVRMSGKFVRQHCIRGGAEFRNTLREEARITMLILCLIGAFFTCQSPFVAYSACRKVGILSTPGRGHSLLRAFIVLVLALKSDCTFVFHCWLNQRFVLALRRMLCSFSTSTVTGRCNASKTNSNDPSSKEHTRTLVKHHTVNATPKDRQMKMLLHEIQIKQPESRKIKLPDLSKRLNFRKYTQLFHEVPPCPPSPRDMLRYAPKLNSSDGKPQQEQQQQLTRATPPDSRRILESTHQSSCPRIYGIHRCFSENDLCTSCSSTACSCRGN